MSTPTEHLGLIKPATSDYVNIADINANMDTIDAAINNIQLTPGADGKSAYEVAVENGYEGTETAWLASLQGENGANGADGADGQSAYEAAQEAGYTGTESDFYTDLAATGETIPITQGGTGQTTAVAAAAALGRGYGTCSTAAATAAKTVEISNFALVTGGTVAVLFSNGNTNTTSTLNINGTGAKEIWIKGECINEETITAGDLVVMVYDGTYYRITTIDSASYVAPVPTFAEATWAEIEALSESGTAHEYWNVGDTREETLSDGEIITIRIEAFYYDNLSAGGKAGITFGMENSLSTLMKMGTTSTNAGGWESTIAYAYMGTVWGMLPDDMKAVIKQVAKITQAGSQSSELVTTNDYLWLFSYTEVGFTDTTYSPGGEGWAYPLFVDNASRIKTYNGTNYNWWLRSPWLSNSTSFCYVSASGANSYGTPPNSYGASVGFCV